MREVVFGCLIFLFCFFNFLMSFSLGFVSGLVVRLVSVSAMFYSVVLMYDGVKVVVGEQKASGKNKKHVRR